jgi:hypothetical protein
MLLLADKGFYSYALWNEAAGTGAHLLWRVTDCTHLPAARELPDGSYLARVSDPAAARKRSVKNECRRRRGSILPPEAGPLPGITVRVIEYILTIQDEDGTTRRQRYRLITTLLDPAAFPAAELAAAYSLRWASETGYREIKTYLRGSGRALRGKTPDLARQEIWALLTVYQALRTLITRAAARDGLDPGRISFTSTLTAARGTMDTPRRRLAAALDAHENQILTCLVPRRAGRICPRTVRKVSRSSYSGRKHGQGPISRHATITTAITPPAPASRTPRNQQEQPGTRRIRPP